MFIAIYHLKLYEIRNLDEKLKDVDLFTQKIIFTINLALTLLLFSISIVSFIYTKELSESSGLTFAFNLILFCFWTWRVIWGETYLKEEREGKMPPFEIVKKAIGPIMIISYLIPIVSNLV